MDYISEILVTCGVLLSVLWWWCQQHRNKEFWDSIPGPPTVPILGNALDFTTTTELFNTFSRYAREYGGIVKMQIGPFQKAILVTDHKFLECILTSTKLLKKSEDYKFVRPWLGTGLLTGDGAKWRAHRRILNPVFHYRMLERFIDVFESCGNILVQKLEEEVAKCSVDIHPSVTLCSLDIICESTMGIRIDAQNNGNPDYFRSVKDMCRIVIERSMSAFQRFDLIYMFTKNYFIQRRALRTLHGQANHVIKEKMKEKEQKQEIESEGDDLIRTKSFLDVLLHATVDGRPLTQEEIREEVDTFMFAGHDTTAAAISFTLYCLANHPEVQKKAFEEQEAIFDGVRNCSATYANLQDMKYLEKVIKETLRLYPSVPIYCRETSKDVIFGDKRLPEGDSIVIYAYGIHRNPRYFDDPETFNPDRFENIDNKLSYMYIPFSAGPRNCIGQKFAMLEMKCIISKILRKFELNPALPIHSLKLAAETVLTSVNGIKISLKLRD